MAATTLVFSWRWLWPKYFAAYFDTLRMLFWFLLEQLLGTRGT